MTTPDPHRVDESEVLGPNGHSHSDDVRQRREQLNNKLTRVRREANAARLEATAERLEATAADIEHELHVIDEQQNQTPTPIESSDADEPDLTRGFVPAGFGSWDDVRQAHASFTQSRIRVDAAQVEAVRAPRMNRIVAPQSADELLESNEQVELIEADQPIESIAAAVETTEPEPESELDHAIGIDLSSTHIVVAKDDDNPSVNLIRRSPKALILSVFVHGAILFFLAAYTLNNVLPKDQIAFSASASEGEDVSIETFAIESSEPVTEPTESEPTETQYDVSEFGEMPMVDMTSPTATPAVAPMSTLSSLAESSSKASEAMKSLQSDSQSKMQFCGVEGGGNHFVYLVDSSGSMGDAFTSARSALLQSIDMLTEKQRFYVVFFDAQCDFMQFSGSKMAEPRSVYATPENKQQLRNWAMRVSMDRGKAPYEPLQFALGLKPDVIFLLSDGEFPQGIEDLLTEENKVTNLFGDADPISIVHTISYHSREGESRMRRIAEKNQGQYRHVPKP